MKSIVFMVSLVGFLMAMGFVHQGRPGFLVVLCLLAGAILMIVGAMITRGEALGTPMSLSNCDYGQYKVLACTQWPGAYCYVSLVIREDINNPKVVSVITSIKPPEPQFVLEWEENLRSTVMLAYKAD